MKLILLAIAAAQAKILRHDPRQTQANPMPCSEQLFPEDVLKCTEFACPNGVYLTALTPIGATVRAEHGSLFCEATNIARELFAMKTVDISEVQGDCVTQTPDREFYVKSGYSILVEKNYPTQTMVSFPVNQLDVRSKCYTPE